MRETHPRQGNWHVDPAGQCWSWNQNSGHLHPSSQLFSLCHSWGTSALRGVWEKNPVLRVWWWQLGQRSKWPNICSFHRTRVWAWRFHCLLRHSLMHRSSGKWFQLPSRGGLNARAFNNQDNKEGTGKPPPKPIREDREWEVQTHHTDWALSYLLYFAWALITQIPYKSRAVIRQH